MIAVAARGDIFVGAIGLGVTFLLAVEALSGGTSLSGVGALGFPVARLAAVVTGARVRLGFSNRRVSIVGGGGWLDRFAVLLVGLGIGMGVPVLAQDDTSVASLTDDLLGLRVTLGRIGVGWRTGQRIAESCLLTASTHGD